MQDDLTLYRIYMVVLIIMMILTTIQPVCLMASNTLVCARSEYSYSPKDIDYLANTKVPIIKLNRFDPNSIFYRDLIYHLVMNISHYSIGEILGFLKPIREYTVVVDGLRYRVREFEKGCMVVSEIGMVYFKYLDGHSLATRSYRLITEDSDLRRLLFNIVLQVNPPELFNISYFGMSGEEVYTGIAYTVYPNGTIKGGTISISYKNPYDIYYIYLGGLRIVYPMKIRGVSSASVKTVSKAYDYLKAQYLEAFIPHNPVVKFIEIDNTLIKYIKDEYIKETGVNPDDIKVYDLYLAISKDYNYLLPIIKVGSPSTNIVIWFQITSQGKAVVYEKAVLAGPPSGPDTGDLIDISKIITSSNNVNNNMLVIYVFIVVIVIASVIVLKYLRRRRA
ncbi:MAG: hypothetical protein DRO40_12380 [Thermoprotei archaeon]|nr:MAG: hypothetical protein DRO40_12380 [Thermoprotei archaeon]